MTIFGRSEDLVSRCIECDLAEPESLASLGASAPGLVDITLSHRPQVIPCISLPNSTSPPSPAPMKSSIHLELTPCVSTSTTTSMYKICLLNTSCDHQLHLDHTNTSPELQDHSIVGSAEPESIHDYEDLLQLEPSVSHLKPHAILKLNLF